MFCGMVGGMGQKTSVYLPDDLAEAVRSSGLSLAGLIRVGLYRVGLGLSPQERVAALPGGAEALRESIAEGERVMASGEPLVTLGGALAEADAPPPGRVEIIPLEPKPAARSRSRRTGTPDKSAEASSERDTGTPEPAARGRRAGGPACKHAHAKKGWCPECRTGGHL